MLWYLTYLVLWPSIAVEDPHACYQGSSVFNAFWAVPAAKTLPALPCQMAMEKPTLGPSLPPHTACPNPHCTETLTHSPPRDSCQRYNSDKSFPSVWGMPFMVLIINTVLNDGVVSTIAYDNVSASKTPQQWHLKDIYLVCGVMGGITCGSSLLFLWMGEFRVVGLGIVIPSASTRGSRWLE